MPRTKEDNASGPLHDPSDETMKTPPHRGPNPSHARHSSKFAGISSRTDPPFHAQSGPVFPTPSTWSGRAEILEHALEQTKHSFPVPKRWVPIAPTPVSAIEIELHILCDGFPGFGQFADQKTRNCFHVAAVATTNSIEAHICALRRRQETGKPLRLSAPGAGRQHVARVRRPLDRLILDRLIL